ncbi:MAG: hypothetical protein U5R48_19040 [Gammaproteobacteria bacterium]|nr:hypothetical protein [Gammaproteobacteria bacterium]
MKPFPAGSPAGRGSRRGGPRGRPHASILEPIGRGHHSGADGDLIRDLEGIDTALGLLGAVIVEVGATK